MSCFFFKPLPKLNSFSLIYTCSRLIYSARIKSSDLAERSSKWILMRRWLALVTVMNWQALKYRVSTGVRIPWASCNLAWLCLLSYNARDLKTTRANWDPGVQDCLRIPFRDSIPDLTIELMPRLRRVLTRRIAHLLDSGPSTLK